MKSNVTLSNMRSCERVKSSSGRRCWRPRKVDCERFDPSRLTARSRRGYAIPTTYAELVALSEQAVADGLTVEELRRLGVEVLCRWGLEEARRRHRLEQTQEVR